MDRHAYELARALKMTPRRVAVVGAGWAGLAAAVELVQAGAEVTLFEMAQQAGGRARDLLPSASCGREALEASLDNGQHICIGAYVETLRLMRMVGVAEADAFVRRPLMLVDAEGVGLRLGRGAPRPAFALAVLRRRGWRWNDRLALLRAAASWSRHGFRCDASTTVAVLCASLPLAVRREFIDPLCIAALNTPAETASGSVFLRVLHDALTSGAGSADLLLPRLTLGAMFPAPALRWLASRGADVRLGRRVEHIHARADGWSVDGQPFAGVVLAASASEAARLAGSHAPQWVARAAALRYEPIVTVYATSAGCRLPEAMIALESDAERPVQFVFDRGQLGGSPGLLALVASGASGWLERGSQITEHAAISQANSALARHLREPLRAVRTIVEKRATFACTTGLDRPPVRVAPGLFAAGDYVAGPYPATLEGAVRSGIAAAGAALT